MTTFPGPTGVTLLHRYWRYRDRCSKKSEDSLAWCSGPGVVMTITCGSGMRLKNGSLFPFGWREICWQLYLWRGNCILKQVQIKIGRCCTLTGLSLAERLLCFPVRDLMSHVLDPRLIQKIRRLVSISRSPPSIYLHTHCVPATHLACAACVYLVICCSESHKSISLSDFFVLAVQIGSITILIKGCMMYPSICHKMLVTIQ